MDRSSKILFFSPAFGLCIMASVVYFDHHTAGTFPDIPAPPTPPSLSAPPVVFAAQPPDWTTHRANIRKCADEKNVPFVGFRIDPAPGAGLTVVCLRPAAVAWTGE